MEKEEKKMATERIFSDLLKEIKEGKFVLTGELEPEVTSDIAPTVKEAVQMKPYVVAANITDNKKNLDSRLYTNSPLAI